MSDEFLFGLAHAASLIKSHLNLHECFEELKRCHTFKDVDAFLEKHNLTLEWKLVEQKRKYPTKSV